MFRSEVLFLSTLKLNIGRLSTSFDLKLSLLNVNILKLKLSVRDRYMTIRISKQKVQLDIVENTFLKLNIFQLSS